MAPFSSQLGEQMRESTWDAILIAVVVLTSCALFVSGSFFSATFQTHRLILSKLRRKNSSHFLDDPSTFGVDSYPNPITTNYTNSHAQFPL
jgi:hypothetical protein